jgi:hypothetical protein
MSLQAFIDRLNNAPLSIKFNETIAIIDEHYDFTPTAFKNGNLLNNTGQNSGSCKLFAFAQLQNLSTAQTLACFGDFYQIDVLQHPDATDHQNIRNFMQFGWNGIVFDSIALTQK